MNDEEYQERLQANVEKFVKGVDSVCNSCTDEPLQAAALACTDKGGLHRGLQTRLMSLFLLWIKELAKNADEGRFDARNKATCVLARQILDDCLAK